MINIDFSEIRYNAIKSLFYFHRNKIEAWYYLITRFSLERDLDIQKALLFGYRHLLIHGDIFWHANNIISQETAKYGRNLIGQIFTFNELNMLLDHIDENGISRGSYGQDVYLIIRLIPNRIDWLKKIILDVETNDNKRLWAAIIIINEFQDYDLERAINFSISMINNFPSSENIDQFQLIRESLIEHSYVDFTG